jgi:putative restriction endonuclease
VERDDDVRAACFAALLVLRAQFGAEVSYNGGLDRGFAFRGRRVPFLNYRERCAICSLREVQLLDAAHIVGDAETTGEPTVSNGLSLCSIHHRAFDGDLVGVSPDRQVHVSRRLLDDEDGPMLDVLKEFHGRPIVVPARRTWQPDRERLAERFSRFLARAG